MGTKKITGVVLVQVAIPVEVEIYDSPENEDMLKVEFPKAAAIKPTFYIKTPDGEAPYPIKQHTACVIADHAIIESFPYLVEDIEKHAQDAHDLERHAIPDKKDLQ